MTEKKQNPDTKLWSGFHFVRRQLFAYLYPLILTETKIRVFCFFKVYLTNTIHYSRQYETKWWWQFGILSVVFQSNQHHSNQDQFYNTNNHQHHQALPQQDSNWTVLQVTQRWTSTSHHLLEYLYHQHTNSDDHIVLHLPE